uniref:glucan endo-1,3-beta-D-glucosidase n=2 Tax=Ditylum brightwellii TaxID=49249 RepID=A0A7S4SAK7_9STRA
MATMTNDTKQPNVPNSTVIKEEDDKNPMLFITKRFFMLSSFFLLLFLTTTRIKEESSSLEKNEVVGVKADSSLANTYPSDPLPFSLIGPDEIGFTTHHRSDDSLPGEVFGSWRHSVGQSKNVKSKPRNENRMKEKHAAMPTNMWYENLLIGSINQKRVTENNRAYTIPYIVDFAGPIPGIRVQFPHKVASDTIVQMATVPKYGLTLGTAFKDNKREGDNFVESAYVLDGEYPPNQLGLGLRWSRTGGELGNGNEEEGGYPTMKTSVLRGIPYVTMKYSKGMKAVLSAEVPLAGSLVIDNGNNPANLHCGVINKDGTTSRDETNVAIKTARVEREVSLTFQESDFTWLIFFNRPVSVECFRGVKDPNAPPLPPGVVDSTVQSLFELHVVDYDIDPLIVRAALSNNCTSGLNALYCAGGEPRRQTHLGDLLRSHSDIYPAHPEIRYEFPSGSFLQDTVANHALIHFDWKPRSMREDTAILRSRTDINLSRDPKEGRSTEMLAYALPHHADSIQQAVGSSNSETGFCSEGLHGRACLIRGNKWVMKEDLGGHPSFVAIRPPHHDIIPSLADAISSDIHFSLPDYFMAGAGDTYFSGKMLAKLGRIIVIASELRGLSATPDSDSFDIDDPSECELKRIVEASKNASLPSDEVMTAAIARLRSAVEVWLNGTAEAKFLYDDGWGGVVNCGCSFNEGTQHCDNQYPDCPAFSDPGLNFGNGFYNDHHFHYGYMIYAAAVVANYDLSWGRMYYEQVLALIRDIANPSIHDQYFPVFRHKDWFLGSSWASGIATLGGQPYLNGRNQESSSEAIHAYEAIGLYGEVMVRAWGGGVSSDLSKNDNANRASRVRDMGRLLTATEIRSAERYWHVLHGDLASNTIYPKVYRPSAVGMVRI